MQIVGLLLLAVVVPVLMAAILDLDMKRRPPEHQEGFWPD